MKPRKDLGHPSDNSLLLAIEGELTPKEAAVVSRHMEGCWECRAKNEEMRRGILEFMAFRREKAKQVEAPPLGWSGFLYRFQNASQEPVVRRNSVRSFPGLRPAWILPVLALAFGGWRLADWLAHPAVVSAREVLQNAAREQAAESVRHPKSRVYQKLLIRKGNRSITREVVRPLQGGESTPATAIAEEHFAPQEADLRQTFAETGLDWNDPLNAEHFAHWRSTVSKKVDTVDFASRSVTITTAAADGGPIREASLSVRTPEWHPFAEEISFRDSSRMEITEVAFAIRGDETIAEGRPSLPAERPNINETATPEPASKIEAISQGELAIAEVRVRAALHNVNADLGEQIEIHPQPAGVLVDGFAGTAARKSEIDAALRGIPTVKVSLRTLADVPVPATDPVDLSPPGGIRNRDPLLIAQMQREFPDAAQRGLFVDRVLQTSQETLMRGWALHRLAERYTTDELGKLDVPSKQLLYGMLSDHANGLEREAADLRKILTPFLMASIPAEDPAPVEWQEAVSQVFLKTRSLDKMCTSAFAAGNPEGLDEPEATQTLSGELLLVERDAHRLSIQFNSLNRK